MQIGIMYVEMNLFNVANYVEDPLSLPGKLP